MATTLPSETKQPTQDALLAEKVENLAIDSPEKKSASKTTSSSSSSLKDATSCAEPDQEPSESPPPGPTTTAFPHPLPQCKAAPKAELTSDQQKKYENLLKTVESWTEIPKTSARFGAPKEAITEEDRLWLTRECLLRYLRATSYNTSAAATRLLATLTWQREYGLRTWTPAYISPENETGKQVILGFDNEGRPCLYLNPSKQNTARSDKQLHHLVFMLERVIDLMAPGQESLALLINFKERGAEAPSVSQGRQTLNILQGHYPERLGRALISELPWYISTFFRLISPFIDPNTKKKMVFNEPLTSHVPPAQLLNVYGGEVEFEYQHDIYWPALNALCERRRRDYRGRWEKAGKKIGEHEDFLRGGDSKCLDGSLSGSEFEEGFMEGTLM